MISKHHPSMFKTPKRLAVAACATAIAAGFQSIPTLAQDDLALEEVIVTATRRDESLQDVAVSVSAITRELGQAQVRRLEDLQLRFDMLQDENTWLNQTAAAKEAALMNEQATRLSLEGSVQSLKEQMSLMQGQLVTA